MAETIFDCPICGTSINADKTISGPLPCPCCGGDVKTGKPLPSKRAKAPAGRQTVICWKCGAEIPAAGIVCQYCGAPKWSSPIYVAVSIIFVGVFFVGVFILLLLWLS